MWVKQQTDHPPVSSHFTIFVGGMVTILSRGWFMAWFYPHYIMVVLWFILKAYKPMLGSPAHPTGFRILLFSQQLQVFQAVLGVFRLPGMTWRHEDRPPKPQWVTNHPENLPENRMPSGDGQYKTPNSAIFPHGFWGGKITTDINVGYVDDQEQQHRGSSHLRLSSGPPVGAKPTERMFGALIASSWYNQFHMKSLKKSTVIVIYDILSSQRWLCIK